MCDTPIALPCVFSLSAVLMACCADDVFVHAQEPMVESNKWCRRSKAELKAVWGVIQLLFPEYMTHDIATVVSVPNVASIVVRSRHHRPRHRLLTRMIQNKNRYRYVCPLFLHILNGCYLRLSLKRGSLSNTPH